LRCDLCTGAYRYKSIDHVYRRNGELVVVEGVPALVCDRCGDTLLSGETTSYIQELLKREAKDAAPLYKFPLDKREDPFIQALLEDDMEDTSRG